MKVRTIAIGMLIYTSFGITGRALLGEYVFTKDGVIKEGSIIAENKASITLKGKDKRREVIPRENIMRLLYTELYMGKVYVQRRDGKNFEAYMVDEDRQTYTFRKEINRPEEIVVARQDVLFVSQMNPSGLKGAPETREVRLEWFPPYNEIRHYIIYKMKKGNKEFAKAGTTRRTRFTVEDLQSNTTFLFKVTALDSTDTESLPSNEISVTTKNIPPGRPEALKVELRDIARVGNVRSLKKTSVTEKRKVLTWKESKDPDGIITGYKVYWKKDSKTDHLTTVRNPMFELPTDITPGELRISAIDERGGESDESWIGADFGFNISVRFQYLTPTGKMSELYKPGFGMMLGFYYENFIWTKAQLGLDSGVFLLESKDNPNGTEETVSFFAYACPSLGYDINLTGAFHIIPYVGYGVVIIKIQQPEEYGSCGGSETVSGTEMLLFGGIDINYIILSWCSFTIGMRWNTIPEENNFWNILSFNAGITFRF